METQTTPTRSRVAPRRIISSNRAILLTDRPREVAARVFGLRTVMVNLFLVGEPGRRGEWALVDGGMPGFSGCVFKAARQLFGNRPPSAIILTHGHFDHVGAIGPFLRRWPGTPVYVHPREAPYVAGQADYLPPDPRVNEGIFSRLSPLFPKHGRDYRPAIEWLPSDGSVPGMPGWRWIHTPGHTPGHVSLFREADRAVIAGDAFVTTRQESFWSVWRQRVEVRPPPAYFTTDWSAARDSMLRLSALNPEIALTGHGRALAGPVVMRQLQRLIVRFEQIGLPKQGRYVEATWNAPRVRR